jgi:hypothetical protein
VHTAAQRCQALRGFVLLFAAVQHEPHSCNAALSRTAAAPACLRRFASSSSYGQLLRCPLLEPAAALLYSLHRLPLCTHAAEQPCLIIAAHRTCTQQLYVLLLVCQLHHRVIPHPDYTAMLSPSAAQMLTQAHTHTERTQRQLQHCELCMLLH